MAPITAADSSSGSGSGSWIPVVDLSPFLEENDVVTDGDEIGKKKKAIMEVVKEACTETGFFQVVNHGVPTQLLDRALQVSAQFFDLPEGEKLKYSSGPDAPLAPGYNRQPIHTPAKNDFLLTFPPSSPFNLYPANPPHLREVIEEVFMSLSKTGSLIEGILNDCLGLPSGVLGEFNSDRSSDFLMAHRYYPATEDEDRGITPHEDSNSVTMVFQDDVGGLEVSRNGEWIPATPEPGAIVVNVGDVIQVLSNNKFKSATHRVVRPKGKSRYSYAFFYSLPGEKWVEPLPQFTEKIGELPKYRKFEFGEYVQLKRSGIFEPPKRPQDIIHITHYSIN